MKNINIIRSEWLKLKKSSSLRMIPLIPFTTVLISILVGGVLNFTSFTVFWWEAVFLFLLIGLLFLSDFKAEQKAGNFQNVKLSRYKLKIYKAKFITIYTRLFLSSIFLLIFMLFVGWLYQGFIALPVIKVSVSLLLTLITAAWTIPFLYCLSSFINPYILLALNNLICLLIAPLIAQTNVWFIFPYTYHYKVSEALLAIKPSGDMLTKAHNNLVVLLVAMALSLCMSVLFSKSFKKVQSHGQK